MPSITAGTHTAVQLTSPDMPLCSLLTNKGNTFVCILVFQVSCVSQRNPAYLIPTISRGVTIVAGFQYLDAFSLWTQMSYRFTIVMFLALTFPLFPSIYINLLFLCLPIEHLGIQFLSAKTPFYSFCSQLYRKKM